MNIAEPHAPEPLEAFPMPDGAITLPDADLRGTSRAMAIEALQQAMRERHLQLPLGPQSELNNPTRCLMLNRIAVQVLPAGILADAFTVDSASWQSGEVPQLLLAALVDEENAVVHFPGVLTVADWAKARSQEVRDGDCYSLDVEQFRGGIDRLFALVQLLEPDALPRFGNLSGQVVTVLDWLRGQVDPALRSFGAVLKLAPGLDSLQKDSNAFLGSTAHGAFSPNLFYGLGLGFAFRGEASIDINEDEFGGDDAGLNSVALLMIVLGIDADSRFVSGYQAHDCVEIFQVRLVPFSDENRIDRPVGLRLTLLGMIRGDVLPERITLRARQGQHRQEATTSKSTRLEFVFQGPEPIEVSIVAPDGSELSLPPLQLPA